MSLGQNGLRDWIIQRFTAIYLAVYTLFLIYFLLKHQPLVYEQWSALFLHPIMQMATIFSLVCVALHAWIGLWTILTDYLKPLLLRYLVQSVVILVLFGYVLWGIIILWE